MEVELAHVLTELPKMCCVCGERATSKEATRFAWSKFIFPKMWWRRIAVELGACRRHEDEVRQAARRIRTRFALSRFLPVPLIFSGPLVALVIQKVTAPPPIQDFSVPMDLSRYEPVVTLPVFGMLFIGGVVLAVMTTLLLRRPIRKTVWFSGTYDQPMVGFDSAEMTALLAGSPDV